jgi:hypothetical protein
MEAAKQQSKAKLLPARFKVAVQVSNDWSAVVEAGTPFEQIKDDQAFWSHVQRFVRVGDTIQIRADDGAYYARLYARAVGAQGVKVEVLEYHDFSKLEAVTDNSDEYKVEWAGPHHKFRIVRVADDVVMQSGFNDKPTAHIAMTGLVKKKAA